MSKVRNEMNFRRALRPGRPAESSRQIKSISQPALITRVFNSDQRGIMRRKKNKKINLPSGLMVRSHADQHEKKVWHLFPCSPTHTTPYTSIPDVRIYTLSIHGESQVGGGGGGGGGMTARSIP